MALNPQTTYLYAGVAYGPGQHDTMPEAARAAIEGRAAAPPAPLAVTAVDPLGELVGDAKLATALREAGYGDVGAIRAAADADLLAVKGIGEATLAKLRIATTG